MNRLFSFIKYTYKDAFRFMRHPREGITFLYNVSLYRNAVYLMLNTGLTAIMGIVFWIVAARFYTEEQVGLGSALISVGMLLSLLGNLGLGFGIIRFLPYSNNKALLLNSSFIITIFASILAATIFLVGLPLWSPKLNFVRESPGYFTIFIIFIIAASLNAIMNQAFIGFRRSGFSLSRGITFNVVRIICLAAFASLAKTFTIFTSWGIGMVASLLICLIFFLPKVLPGFRPFFFKLNDTNVVIKFRLLVRRNKEMIHFSIANYSGQILQSAPMWVLPIMVLNLISAEATAHFYIAWSVASILLNIAMMTSMSLFAEGSNLEESMEADLKKSLKLIIVLILPAVIIILLLGDKLLLLFGRDYSDSATHLLWLLAISALPASLSYLYLGVARIEKKLKTIVIVTGILAFGSLLMCWLMIYWLDITGVGLGWLITQSAVALVCFPRLMKRLKIHPKSNHKNRHQEFAS